MKRHLKDYKARLEKEIGEYMALPASERSAKAIDGMLACWTHIDEAERYVCGKSDTLSAAELSEWIDHMQNADGTHGGHWDIAQTSAVAESIGIKPDMIPPHAWNAAMNMMYSDYFPTAARFGIDKPEFYAELARDFLLDPDGGGGMKKLAEYYRGIVE